MLIEAKRYELKNTVCMEQKIIIVVIQNRNVIFIKKMKNTIKEIDLKKLGFLRVELRIDNCFKNRNIRSRRIRFGIHYIK